MKKKVYIYILILTFFASTTALPLTQHLCKMMDNSEEECMMHSQPMKSMMHDCCSDRNISKVVFSDFAQNCCEVQVVDNRITDEYLSVNKDTYKENTFIVILLSADLLFNEINPLSISSHNIHNTSPPFYRNDLYIHNSILLI
jgi:hypothetical protein